MPHDVRHRNPFRQQVVGDDAAVAAPPHSFGTHNGAAMVPGERSKFVQSPSERVSCRVIGVVSESRDPPERIGRWHRSRGSVAQTAKGGQMTVRDPSVNERSGRASALNCGFVRERGIERTSTSRSTVYPAVRVEWPIVKIVGIAWDCSTGFLRPSTPINLRTRERGLGKGQSSPKSIEQYSGSLPGERGGALLRRLRRPLDQGR